MYSYHIWRAWYNGSYAIMAKPIRGRKLHYLMIQFLIINRAFSHDVTAAILVFQNNRTAAMLVYQDNPLGVELFSYVKTFFRSNKLA